MLVEVECLHVLTYFMVLGELWIKSSKILYLINVGEDLCLKSIGGLESHQYGCCDVCTDGRVVSSRLDILTRKTTQKEGEESEKSSES